MLVAKYADKWVPVHAGQDGAFWMAVTHVILKEYHHEKKVPILLIIQNDIPIAPFWLILEKKMEFI